MSAKKEQEIVWIPDEELFRDFLAGSNSAGMLLFKRYNTNLLRYSSGILNNPDAAEDITQAVWEKIIHMRQKPVEVQNVGGYLFTIARNLCLNNLSASARFYTAEERDEQLEKPPEPPSNSTEAVMAALEELEFEDRELLTLHFFSGYALKEIAEMLRISESAVWTRASRARAKLRESFKKNSIDDTFSSI